MLSCRNLGLPGLLEVGFHLLQVIIKTLVDNVTVFFLVISAITFYFLYCTYINTCRKHFP